MSVRTNSPAGSVKAMSIVTVPESLGDDNGHLRNLPPTFQTVDDSPMFRKKVTDTVPSP